MWEAWRYFPVRGKRGEPPYPWNKASSSPVAERADPWQGRQVSWRAGDLRQVPVDLESVFLSVRWIWTRGRPKRGDISRSSLPSQFNFDPVNPLSL